MKARVQGLAADLGVDGRDHPRPFAPRQQHVVNQVRGGGFAVCARHPHHRHLPRWVVVKRRRKVSQRLAWFHHLHIRHARFQPGLHTHHRAGPAPHRIRDEAVPIHRAALQRHK